MVRSVVIDDQGLFSDVAEKNLLVDYTPPLLRGTIVGGLSESTDLSSALLQTSFRWRVATDPHSGVTTYKYGWSLTQSDTANAIVWMGQTASNSIVFRPRVLLPRSYYFVVCAVNGAGLWSEPIFSEVCHPVSVATVSAGTPYDGSERDGVGDILLAEDGSVAVPRLKAILPDFLHLWPNPTNEVLNVCLPESMLSLAIFDACGQEVYERRFGGTVLRESHCEERVDVSTFRPGIYFVRVVGRNGRLFSAKFLKQ